MVCASVVGPGVGHKVATIGTDVSVTVGTGVFIDDTLAGGAVGGRVRVPQQRWPLLARKIALL